ncbi:MAG TPA: gamma-glutamyl-phosphate reductase, partial [Clostridia bacterium]|nr:gamma-glutamyl-phosphate reductase [Clostridia bacterium]
MAMVREAAKAAKAAAVRMAVVPASMRDAALRQMADSLESARETLLAANGADLRAAGALPGPLQKRLVFDDKKLKESVQGLRALADLPDPIGQTTLSTELAEG